MNRQHPQRSPSCQPLTARITRHSCLGLLLFLAAMTATQNLHAEDWFDRKADWHGFEQLHFKVAERSAYVVTPQKPLPGNPWIWRARFPGYHAEMDIELVKQGFHIGYVDVAGMFGSPKAMKICAEFYEFMTRDRALSQNPAMEGVSRGGLVVYNWAARHPTLVSCIYCDTPVLDIKSWPAGKGQGLGSAPTWKQCLAAYEFTEQQALEFDGNPLDHAAIIAKHRIPILHIVSETDKVVPPKENTYILSQRLQDLGHKMAIISVPVGTEKSNGHHFTHPDPTQVVNFIRQHAAESK